MQVVMVMFRGDGQRRSFSITRDMTVIGRREDCDLRIPLGDVSRKHCRLIKDAASMRVEDLGSSNGTYRNGERIQQSEVTPGDTIQVGPVVFVLQVDGFPADDDLTPVTSASAVKSAEEKAAASENTNTPDESASDESALPGEFDPLEALESAEGSAFDFTIEESQHGEGAGIDANLEESGSDQQAV
jgi:pSer/pThr/pTyr-binding forkhead associated (FHA) protein